MNRQEFDALYNSTQCTQQDPREFWELVQVVAGLQPKRILEIGSAHGGTLLFWQALASEKVVSLDFGPLQGGIPMSRFDRSVFITGNSHLPETKALVEQHAPFDFLFIDGDHSYEGSKLDWEMYSSLVRPGGVVGFHDTAYGRLRDLDTDPTNMGCGKTFAEIQQPKDEFFTTHGIGVVYL